MRIALSDMKCDWLEGDSKKATKGMVFTQKSVIPAFDGILLTLHCISPLF